MIQITILSARISLDFTGSKLATGAFNSAKVSGLENEQQIFHEQSRPPAFSTRAEDRSNQVSPLSVNWIAGVGDVCNYTPNKGTYRSGASTPACAMKIEPAQQNASPPTYGLCQHPEGKRSALQRHCDFWDADQDGLIYPWDIYIGFRKLGFNIALCLWAAVTMAICSSYSTQANWLPHPLFAINVNNIHRNRHGSTTATYDMDAEIDLRRFNAIFDKYADGKDYLTSKTLYKVWAGQCCANDWFGWFAGGLECKCSQEWLLIKFDLSFLGIALYILLWPRDGKLRKDDILGVFDGTIFSKIASQRAYNVACS
jgi:hypothetical protein